MTPFNRLVLNAESPLAMPVAVYPGLHLSGGTVRQMVTDAAVQERCARALVERYRLPCALSAMDLSAEAEAFGATIRLDDHEVPTVLGRLISDAAGVAALRIPEPGARRTAVHLDTVRRLAQGPGRPQLVVGGLIGPFSLAGRLWGVSEALELTATDPELALDLVAKATAFLLCYAQAFKDAGADAVIMAEPAAGLLSPKGLGRFSSPFVKQIITAVEDERFGIILHNCGAKPAHLPQLLASGASAFHVGQPMDITAALDAAGPERVVCGNLDPSAVFVGLAPAALGERTAALMQSTAGRRTFVASSGCDLPPQVTLAHLDAFFAAVR